MDNGLIGKNGRRGIGEKIREMRRNGASSTEIIKELKCAKSTVNYHCKKIGLLDIGHQKDVVNKSDRKAIAEYSKTHTVKECMVKYGYSRTTTIKYMTRKGILLTEETKKDIYEYTKDHTRKETAIHFGVSYNTVVKYRRKDYKK